MSVCTSPLSLNLILTKHHNSNSSLTLIFLGPNSSNMLKDTCPSLTTLILNLTLIRTRLEGSRWVFLTEAIVKEVNFIILINHYRDNCLPICFVSEKSNIVNEKY